MTNMEKEEKEENERAGEESISNKICGWKKY
jgi:hypothetical protein